MSKTKLQFNVLYELDMREMVQYGPVLKQRLYERFTDGRISGLLNEDLIPALFVGFTRSDISGGSHDLIDKDGDRYEARTITRNGVNLRPSNQKGQGRIKDDEAALERRRLLHGYIFVDVRDSPTYRIFALTTQVLGAEMNFTPSQIGTITSDFPRKKL